MDLQSCYCLPLLQEQERAISLFILQQFLSQRWIMYPSIHLYTSRECAVLKGSGYQSLKEWCPLDVKDQVLTQTMLNTIW